MDHWHRYKNSFAGARKGGSMPRYGIAALSLVLVTVNTAVAQVERASIIGNVTDTTGAAMAGAIVSVTNESTNTSVRLVTDDSGAYTAVNLIPGSYSVNATRNGFK